MPDDAAEMSDALDAAATAAHGDSNDDEFAALYNALELALRRWPEVHNKPPF